MTTRSVLLGFGAVALIAGCGSSSSGGPATQPTSTPLSPSPTPSQSNPVVTTPSPTVTVTVTHSPSLAACSSSHLALSLGIGQGTAGTTYQALVLTNTGSTSCTLFGYPGVSFLDSGGAIIGQPSARDPGAVHTITLAAGGTANALSRQPDAGNFPSSVCAPKTSDRVRVYPPNQKQPLFVHDAIQLCSTSKGRTGIGPTLAGNGG